MKTDKFLEDLKRNTEFVVRKEGANWWRLRAENRLELIMNRFNRLKAEMEVGDYMLIHFSERYGRKGYGYSTSIHNVEDLEKLLEAIPFLRIVDIVDSEEVDYVEYLVALDMKGFNVYQRRFRIDTVLTD